ncbi:unnamed protein product [Symbiodinium sp. KB8]|nr:unnamed protein product [Symbiodinium sp. KB8]
MVGALILYLCLFLTSWCSYGPAYRGAVLSQKTKATENCSETASATGAALGWNLEQCNSEGGSVPGATSFGIVASQPCQKTSAGIYVQYDESQWRVEMLELFPAVRQERRILSGLRAALDSDGRGLHFKKGVAAWRPISASGETTVAEISEAATFKSEAGKAEVSKPSVDMLPAAPSGASIALPKGGTAPSSSTGPSLEKTQLEALTGCLAAVKDTLPTEVRETLERLQLASSANNTKDMHRAVAAQATAKKQLIQVQNARASYLEAWNSYVSQVTQLLKKQVEEQAAQLESYDEAELQWSGALEQTTADLADLARLARNPASSRNEADEEEMDSEDMVIADIQTAKELEQRRESQLADSRQLVSMMESVQQAATRQLKQEGRDGSRTPRRKSREGEVTDLTKDEDAAKAKAEKAAAKPTPPVPCGHSVVNETDYVAPFFAAFLGVSLSFEIAIDELGSGLSHTYARDPRAEAASAEDQRWAHWAPPEVEDDLGCTFYEALAGQQPRERKGRTLTGIERSPLPFHFPSQRMSLLGVERDAGSGCASQDPAARAPSRPVSMVSDLQAMIASHVPMWPEWIQGPLLHMSPYESRLLSGLFPTSTDRDRFLVCECRLDHLVKGARLDWSLLDFVAAALRAVTYRVRLVWYVIRPLEGLPTPQFVLTAVQAPAGGRAVPVDLRPLDGLLHTVELVFPGHVAQIWPLLHGKGVDPGGRLEQAWRDGSCRFENEQGQPVDRLDADCEVEWLALRPVDRANPLGLVVDYIGGPGAILRVPMPVPPPCGSSSTTCTTTAVQPLAFHGQALTVAEVAVLPEELISHADRVIALSSVQGLRIFFQNAAVPQRRYVLFERVGHMHIRRLGVTWTLEDVVRDVMSVVPMLRCIQILHSPLDRLPVLQIAATELGWPVGSLAVPFDLRGGDTRHPMSEAQFYTPAFPAVWTQDPAVAQVVSDDADSPRSQPSASSPTFGQESTTTTTGAMQWAGLRITRQGIDRTEEHRLAAHVQLVVFTTHSIEYGHHSHMGAQLADALAPLLAQVLERGHGPRMGYLQATRVLPMLEGRTWMVPIIWAERTGTHVQVILDTRWGNGDIQLLTLPLGTTADQVLPFSFQSQGKPVPGFHFGHAVSLMPDLRVLTLPISLVDARPKVSPKVLEISKELPETPMGPLAEFQQCLHLLKMPWHQFWRSDWDVVKPVNNLPFPPVVSFAELTESRRFHIFTDGSKLGSGADVQCGWGLVLCGEDPVSGALRCGGFSGGSLEPFLRRPLGASPSSFDAEVVACIVATCWAACLPEGSEVLVWHDCQGAGSLLAGDCSSHAPSSIASRLRPLALWCQHSGIALRVNWVPSHSGYFLNELVDSVAKAGARHSFPAPAFPSAFWQLLTSPFLSWAWLGANAQVSGETGMPPLELLAAGQYEPRDPIPLDCVPVPATPEQTPVTADLHLRFLTCNVQTLKEKRPLVLHQLKERKVHVAGLQETRDTLSSQCFGNSFIEFAAAADKGEGGVTLLFNRSQPYGRAKGQSLFFDKSHFTCVHADPRCIAVQIRAPHLQILCVCAHAPHSGQPLATISDWWQWFEQAPWLARHKGRIVLLIDSNAQLGSVTGDAVQGHAADEENHGGTFLRSWVETTDSFLPSTVCASDGQCVPNAREPTWFSPSGCGYRIDFVGLPRAWARCAFKPCTWPDFELLNKDHIPATADVSLQIQARPHAARGPQTFPRDPAQWPAAAIDQLKQRIKDIPSLPWYLNVHEHVRLLQQAIHQAGKQCRPPPRRRCRAFISACTRDLLDGTKLCKKRIANLHGLARKLESLRSKGRVCLSSEGWTLSDVQSMLADLCTELRSWRRSLRMAVAWDKSEFVRNAHTKLLDSCDPFDARQFFDAVRALRPPAKRVLKPFSQLVVDEQQASHQDRLDMQQDHFAALEAGTPCTASEYLDSLSGPAAGPSDCFQLQELPTWPKVEEAFRACKARKTPGADQIPDWVWRIGPQDATRLWLPIFAKAHVRLSEPVQFKHTVLFALFKGKGSPAVVSNYRAIALLSGPGKILRKQMRGALLQQLPENPLQQGGIPQSLLQGVHQVVKLQADIAAAVGASNSALFLDVSSAYYRVLRQAFQGPLEDDRQICHILGRLGVRPESLHCVCDWLASTNLVEGASAHHQRLLREYLSGTFFALRGGGSLVHTKAGTRPGDAIADTLFALVQADFLAGVRDNMEKEDMLTDPVVSRVQGGPKLLAPVWADDSVVLLAADNADRLFEKTQRTAGIVHSEFVRRGMAPNYARGKSEVLFAFRGKGAPALRQRLFIRQGGLVSFCSTEGSHRIFCTRRYVHLGGVVCDRRTEAGDICQHLAQARQQIKPMRRQILRDPGLPLATRRMCLSSLAFSCVTTTAPTWRQLNKAESTAWRRGYVSLLRSLHRDDRWTGAPSLPGERDVCLATGMPSPAAYLKGQRLMHFKRVCLTQPVLADLLLAEFQVSSTPWLSMLQEDALWLSKMVQIPESALADFPHGLADWCVHHEAPFKNAVRKALRNLKAEGYEPDWAAPRSLCTATPAGMHRCEQCSAAFDTKHALAAHRFAKHGQACIARDYLHGTACPACLMQFWTTARVTRHLMHDSPQCLRALRDHAFEGDAGSRKVCTDTADLPATRLYGPLRPFHVQISEFASRAADGDSSLSAWLNSYRSPAMQEVGKPGKGKPFTEVDPSRVSMLLRCEQKYTNLLSQKDRELQLAAVKEQGLEDKLEKLELKSSQLDDAHLGNAMLSSEILFPTSPNWCRQI